MFGVGPTEGLIVFVMFALQFVVPIGFLMILLMLFREMRRLRESIDQLRDDMRK